MILRNQCCCKFAEDMATILLLAFSQVFPLANFKTIWLVGNLTCFLPNDPLVLCTGYVPTQRLEWKRYKQYTRNDIMAAIEEVKKGKQRHLAAIFIIHCIEQYGRHGGGQES